MDFNADDLDPDLPAADDSLSLGGLDGELGYVLRRAQLTVFRRFFATFDAEDIKPAQYSTLVIIESNPGVAQGRIASALSVKKTNFVAMVAGLEGRGLIERRPSQVDRRIQCLFLTEAGADLVCRLRAMSRQTEDRIAARLGVSVYEELFAPLGIIARGDF